MDRLELEFSICFTFPDLDKTYSIDKITKKVIERIGKRRGNVMIIKQRTNQKETYYIEIFLIALLIIVYAFWGITLISVILTLVFCFAIYWIIESKINSKRHDQKLKVKIMNQQKDS
jgi:4-hydroxybenzoate polyprenyltransferase